MFGRNKNAQATASESAADALEVTTDPSRTPPSRSPGKGRPTPSRREAQQRNLKPLVAPSLPANATKEERKAAKKARRMAMDAQRAQQRTALYTGDEAHLPSRDRGKPRRWARDFVDARRSIGEMFLPVAMIVLLLSLVNNPATKIASVVILYAMLLAVVVDSWLVRRTLKRELAKRFGTTDPGAAGYGMMRSLQYRRFRLPKPQVARGKYPA